MKLWWLAITGILGICVEILTFMLPGMTALPLLFTVAGWAISIGDLQIICATRLRKEIDNEWLLILGGVISVLFDPSLVVYPGAGALSLVWLIAAYAIIAGIFYIFSAFKLKNVA